MIYSFSKQNGGGGGADATMRASGFTQSELSGSSLVFKNLSGTEVGSVELSGLTPSEVTELNAVSAVPVSGAAGSVIALNKPTSNEWISFTGTSQINWTKIKGSCSESTWINVHLLPSDTWSRLGSFDGENWINDYAWLDNWTVVWDGDNFTASIQGSVGTCYMSGTTDGTNWEIDLSDAVDNVEADWEIPSGTEIYVTYPQKISIYQANSGNTYDDVFDKLNQVKVLRGETNPGPVEFTAGDVVSVPQNNRVYYLTQAGTGLNNYKEIAFRDEVTVGAASGQNNLIIWRGSQQDYDAITTKDSDTMYVII